MSLDLTTLRLLKYRERYQRLAQHVPARALDTKTAIILKDFGRFFSAFPDAGLVHPDAFSMYFKQIHPTLKTEEYAVYDQLFKRVHEEDVSPDIEKGLMARLMSAAVAYDLACDIEKFNNGDEIDLRMSVAARLDEYDKVIDRKIKNPQVLVLTKLNRRLQGQLSRAIQENSLISTKLSTVREVLRMTLDGLDRADED